MNIENKRDISIIVAALDLYKDYLAGIEKGCGVIRHIPNLDQLPYTITDTTNLFETINNNLENN